MDTTVEYDAEEHAIRNGNGHLHAADLSSDLSSSNEGRPSKNTLAIAAARSYAEDEDFFQAFELELRVIDEEMSATINRVRGRLRPAVTVTSVKAVAETKTSTPKVQTEKVDALEVIRAGGSEGISARALSQKLGKSAREVVAPLIERGAVKKKGEAGGTRYIAK